MSHNVKRHLLTLYTRTPLHVGSGTSVDVVDLPIMRERITGFPVIPASSLKGVLRQQGRDRLRPEDVLILFGPESGEDTRHAGCLQIVEAKLLAFPVRSVEGCFAWLTCPLALSRFSRDTGRCIAPPDVGPDQVLAGSDLVTSGGEGVFEEYALKVTGQPGDDVVSAIKDLCEDPVWIEKLTRRLAIVSDGMFQTFVSTCTEVVARIQIDPATRTNQNLFNQENVPCETLFYALIHVLPPRTSAPDGFDAANTLHGLLPAGTLLQVGGDETTGHGFCDVKLEVLP